MAEEAIILEMRVMNKLLFGEVSGCITTCQSYCK
jgi:hypothetical protein